MKILKTALACLVVGTMFGGLLNIARASTTNFNVGDTVEVTTNLNVRTGPGTSYPEITDPDYPGYAPTGTRGEILNGPVSADGYTWWEVDFGPGLYSGWSVEDGLKAVDTLSVSLSADPSGGTAPLNDVDLTAGVSGSASGSINYTFYCDRADSGTDITPGWAVKFDGVFDNPKTAVDVCDYSAAGTYTAKVIVERGSALPAEDRVIITVNPQGSNYSIFGHVRDGSGNSISGVVISAGAGGSATTDASGAYTIGGLTAGTYILIPSKSGWTFTPATRTVSVPPDATEQDFTGSSSGPPPNEQLLQAIDLLDEKSRNELDRLGTIASDAGENGDYFCGAVASDAVKLSIDLVLGFADMAEVHHEMTQRASQLALPGMEPSWSRILNLKERYPDAGKLFDLRWQHAIQTGNWEGLTRPILRGGSKYYVARLRDTAIETIVSEGVIWGWHDIVASRSGLSEGADRFEADIDDLKQALDDQRAQLVDQGIPSMSWAEQEAYIADLTGRHNVPVVLVSAMEHQGLLLENVRMAHESTGSGWTAFVLKFLAKNIAHASFDGPGNLLVSGFITAFDGYLDYHNLTAAGRAYQQAPAILKGSAETAARIFLNDAKGLDRLARHLPANPATGSIGDVTHYSAGTGWGRLWREHESFTDVEMTNTGDETATFEVIVQYAYYDRVFGLPWSWNTLVTEKAIVLASGHSAPVRIYYKQEERGGSPEKDSIIYINVLVTNDTGTFHVGSHVSTWQPQRMAASSIVTLGPDAVAQALDVLEDAPVIENPIDSYVLSDPWNQGYEAHLWVANPFTKTITVNVTQTLPSDVTLLESGDAVVNDFTLIWQKVISAETVASITYTFRYLATPGTLLNLPAARMGFAEPVSGQYLTTQSNTSIFEALWPVLVEGYAPWAVADTEATIPVTVTNLLTDNVSGSLTVTISDTVGRGVYSQTQLFTLAAAVSDTLTFALPSALPNGIYPLEGTLYVQGASQRVLRDEYRVGALGPTVHAWSEPTGFIHPGQLLTHTVSVSNTTGVTLTGGILTATLPVSTSLVPGSISDGGLESDEMLHWNLDSLPDGAVFTATFQVQVASDAVSGNENLPIESLPVFVSDQTVLTFGFPALNTVVVEKNSIYLPLISCNYEPLRADFSAWTTFGVAPLKVTFTNTSSVIMPLTCGASGMESLARRPAQPILTQRRVCISSR